MNMIQQLFDLNHCPVPDKFEGKTYPWEVLPFLGDICEALMADLDDHYEEISPGVFVGEGTTMAPAACIEGPTIIGKNCVIRHGAYIRGKVIIGDDVVIGNASEVKNALIFDGAQIL